MSSDVNAAAADALVRAFGDSDRVVVGCSCVAPRDWVERFPGHGLVGEGGRWRVGFAGVDPQAVVPMWQANDFDVSFVVGRAVMSAVWLAKVDGEFSDWQEFVGVFERPEELIALFMLADADGVGVWAECGAVCSRETKVLPDDFLSLFAA